MHTLSPAGLGPVLAITSVSTLYTDVESARQSAERFVCGLPIETNVAVEGFDVPDVADGATGFFVRQSDPADGDPPRVPLFAAQR